MRRLNSAQFKREWRALEEPVIVTIGKKAVGIYQPTNRHVSYYALPNGKWRPVPKEGEPSPHQVRPTTGRGIPWQSSSPWRDDPWQ